MARGSRSDGGCIFCESDDEYERLYFDEENDVFFHKSCLIKAFMENPDDPDVQDMKYILNEEQKLPKG